MAKNKDLATPIPDGTHVHWHYRGAIGHGTIKSVHTPSTKKGDIIYNIAETDHHPGEAAVLHHYGRALTVGR